MVKKQEQQKHTYLGEYELRKLLGEGSFGQVYTGVRTGTKLKVAVKRFKPDVSKDCSAMIDREINMLIRCAHPHVVSLLDVFQKFEEEKTLVFEFIPKTLDSQVEKLPRCRILPVMYQLLLAVSHCHAKGVLHSDIKPDNILMDSSFNVKLADFGLATDNTCWGPHHMYALMYRAPELVLGARNYTIAADMWAVGCVFAELLLKESLFQVRDEKQLLQMMCDLCGVPGEKSWPGVSQLPDSTRLEDVNVSEGQPRLREVMIERLESRRMRVDHGALDLLECMLVMNPRKRITALEALEHFQFSY